MITMMTIGFGDFFPKTYLGRLFCIIACFWGVFMISIIVLSMTNAVAFTKRE